MKDTKLQMLITRFEELKMSEDESFDSFYSKLNEVEEPKFQVNENVIESVLVTLQGKVKEGRRFLNEEKDPTTSKELNEGSHMR